MSLGDTIDVSPEEMDRIKRRREIRQKLKAEYNRQAYNPYRQVYRIEVHDPAVERAMAARAHRYEHFKPTWKSFLLYYGMMIGSVALVSAGYRWEHDAREHLTRTGQLSYKDQEYKMLRVPNNVHQCL